jgi:hypothetical protein
MLDKDQNTESHENVFMKFFQLELKINEMSAFVRSSDENYKLN